MSELQKLLTEFAAGRVALIERHEASARTVSHYDFNNTYQYVINREETQLSWLQNALAEYGAVVPPAGADALPAPPAPTRGGTIEAGAFRGILEDDARYFGAFVERWRACLTASTGARHFSTNAPRYRASSSRMLRKAPVSTIPTTGIGIIDRGVNILA